MKKTQLIFVFVVTVILLIPSLVFAQNKTIQEIGISPFLIELDVAKGGSVSSSIDVSNNSDVSQTVSIKTQDFLPGQKGQPEFVPNTEIGEPSFSLATWIKINEGSSAKIEPHKVTKINFKVSPPVNAEQGSHYGAILFSYAGDTQLSGVGVTQTVGAIILVRYGEARSNGSLEFSSSKNLIWWNDKIDFTNKFNNTGNVHVKPKGEVVVKNMFGKIVSTPSINRDAANVLPKSDRTFISDWQPGPWSFGRYKAESIIIYGRERLEVRATQIIWILPLYILFVIGIFIALVLWYSLHGRHWHRRRIIKKHLQRQQELEN